ncbi:glucose sorbosone dehydrogenase [Embleya scabrispora]|uniref:Glucose sorbosone dehydrogenase n=1 Tax=Embleya scabrispora TaxID=159449 RepID=A0A1T3P722_9ACTN|nr:PQQ-dependent sugar dehydrogenase [Embleya scabrispora]OPC84898.1 glucose sorbosone dehydrogenase [Embleya scabrispora]
MRSRRPRAGWSSLVLVVALATGLTSCGGGGESDDHRVTPVRSATPVPGTGAPNVPAGPTATAPPEPVVAGELARDLNTPWGVAVLPDRDALVSSRDTGTITRFGPGTVPPVPVGTVPGSVHRGEGGLLGIAVSPRFATDHFLYAYLTTDRDNRIVRMTYVPGQPLGQPEVLLDGIPAGSNHNGGRIAFGPDGMLYAGTGEAGRKEAAQDKSSLGGKILRLTPEGRPAPGNPFPNSPVWSLGHRNVQGLAWDSTGRLWASEFGQDTWDELNLIRSGANYGWPEVEGAGDRPEYMNPVAQWATDDASPSGIAILGDVVYLAGLKGERLWRAPITGSTVGEPKAYFQGRYGRLRTVVAVGGELWLVTNTTDGRGTPRKGDDRILRLVLS